MNSFFEYFVNDIRFPNTPKVFTEYVTKKSKFKKHIFVEGFSDKNFYSTFLDKELKVFPGDIGYFICNGKKGVIEICNYLNENYGLSKNDKTKFFIVDRDYDGLNNYNCLLKEKITVTKYYSFESYAFMPENLEIIYEIMKLDSNEKNTFKKVFSDFVDKILTYEALISLRVKGRITYWNTKSLEKDYTFIVNDNKLVLEDKFTKDIETIEMMLSEKEHKDLELEKEILKNNYLYMRGHDLELVFNLFSNSILDDKKLSKLLTNSSIVKKFKIPITIK